MINKAISKAKIGLMTHRNTMFLSTVCCSLETQVTTDVPYAATNGKVIKINPDKFMELTEQERVFLLAHETLHVVYMHMTRRGDRDPRMFNAAADYVINGELIRQGFTMIEGGLNNPRYYGLGTEQVYELLKEKNKCDEPNPLDGDVEESTGSPEDISELENEVRDAISRAAQLADIRDEGASVPKSVRRYLEELSKPKVNWRVVLRRFMQSLDKSDYSWSRPNKRYAHAGMYLPHMKGEAMSKITFAIDTSGSVSENEFKQFISEIHSVLKTLKPKEIEVLQFDHLLQSVDTVKSVRELAQVEFKGNGGTNPTVAINHFLEGNSMALIVITDGEFHTQSLPKVRKPVVWVIFDNQGFVPPYGKAVHISLK